MNNSNHFKESCELIQLSISDAIDANQSLNHSDKMHIDSCSECANFYQVWRHDSSLSIIASGSVSEQVNLSIPILSTLTENNIIRGKFLKLASIAAMIAIVCLATLSLPKNESQQSNITITEKPEETLNIKIPKIKLSLTEEKIEKVLENKYQSLSESATQKWKTATTGIAMATEYIANGTHYLSSKYLAPQNQGTSGPQSRLIPQPVDPNLPQYG